MRLFRVDEFDEEFISEKLIEIYSRATDWLWFSTSLHPDFFNREEIKDTLTRLSQEGVSIRVLLDEDVDVDARREKVPWIFDRERIEVRQSTHDISHRVISDRTDLRLEKDHKPAEKGAANLIAMDAAEDLKNPYRNEFDEWWDLAKAVN